MDRQAAVRRIGDLSQRRRQTGALDVTRLLLNPQGTAWILDPPNASFAGVTYSVNGTAAEALDQANAVETGIQAVRAITWRYGAFPFAAT